MDQWSRARFKSLFWPHWLECFWGCCKRPGRLHRDCNTIYQFLWEFVHSYQDLSNLQQWQTVVHCKTQTAPSGQRRCLQEGGQCLVQTGQIHTGKEDQSGKEELFWKAKEQILLQWFCFRVEMSERHHQLQETIPQHCRESEWVLLQVWKKTPFTPLATPLSPHLHWK